MTGTVRPWLVERVPQGACDGVATIAVQRNRPTPELTGRLLVRGSRQGLVTSPKGLG